MLRGVRSFFSADDTGAIGPAYAVGILALVAIAGVGFDYGRLAGLDTELQNAADQAALAGATQLDGQAGACSRAFNAAKTYITNNSRIETDAGGPAITFVNGLAAPANCEAVTAPNGSFIKFWQDSNDDPLLRNPATGDADAHFIEVNVDARTVVYALTPLVGAISSGMQNAAAMAGLGSSICKVPPLMICSPNPALPFNAEGKKGWGFQATGHGGSNAAWAPGDFGFLEVGNTQTADLERALAFKDLPFDCTPIEGTKPETGNAQGLYRAVNTRFDIYDDQGQPLNVCLSGQNCPAASNVVKDMIKTNSSTNGNNDCKTHVTQGWRLVTNQFWPRTGAQGTDTNEMTYHDTTKPAIDAMGMTRDLCHYDSYVEDTAGTVVPGNVCNALTGLGTDDPEDRFGPGRWARRDYFDKYHVPAGRTWPPAVAPEYLMDSTDDTSFTRYGLYKWELAGNMVSSNAATGQRATPICSTGSAGAIDRRVLTLAVVKNCADLSGGSTAVEVDEWIDAFLVQPVVDGGNARNNGDIKDSIYMEVIGPAILGGSAVLQTVRRDVPYLVQ